MRNEFELSYKRLKSTCNPNLFKFETTESLEPISAGIGQERGIKALEFGLNVTIFILKDLVVLEKQCTQNTI